MIGVARLFEMPKTTACGSFLSASSSSLPLLKGESARTAMPTYSAAIMASGVISR